MRSLHNETTLYKKRMFRVRTLLFLAVCIVCTLSACSSSPSPSGQTRLTATPLVVASSPTPTPLPHGTILYQGDWVHNLKSWQPSSGWKVIDGMLQSTTTGDPSITLPYRPTVNDYALRLRLRVYNLTAQLGSYFLATDPTSGHDGYRAGVINFPRPDKVTRFVRPEMEVSSVPTNPDYAGTAHDLGILYEWHDYRLEIHGKLLTFYLDDQVTGRALSQTDSFVSDSIRLELSSIGVQVSEFNVVVP